jgi:fatty acid desaturase
MAQESEERRAPMLMTIFIFLLALWLLGMISSYTLGGYVHLLLVIAIVVLLIRLIQGRAPL